MRSLIALFCFTFIVEAQQNPGCLKDWSYFAKTNKCFKVFGGQFDPIRPTTWSLSEEYCKKFNGGHLASFHSDDEVTFVVGCKCYLDSSDLSQKALWDDGYAGHMHIGLTYIGNHDWEWVDGSSFTYIKWWNQHVLDDNNAAFDAANPRGLLHTKRLWIGTFWADDNNEQSAFACQMPPSTEG